jgi:hypothetical protein
MCSLNSSKYIPRVHYANGSLLNMVQSYISDDLIAFIRLYGILEGAAGFMALLSTLESNPPVVQLKGVCFDARAATHVTLHDSDRANGSFLASILARYGQDINSLCLVAIFNPENVSVNKVILERIERLATPILGPKAIQVVYSVPDALKALCLPVDYCIEYPPEK